MQKNTEKKDTIKSLVIRIPKESWTFIRYEAVKYETSINGVINMMINKHKNKLKKLLTEDDTIDTITT